MNPTKYLDAETAAWLAQHLQKYEGPVTAVTHDRFLDNVPGSIPELDRGRWILWKRILPVGAKLTFRTFLKLWRTDFSYLLNE